MKKISSILTFAMLILASNACTDQLQNLQNPNQPTVSGNITNERGLATLARGGTWINGFVNQMGWLGDSYFSLPWAYSELNADLLGAQAANQNISSINLPKSITPSGGGPTFFTYTQTQTQNLRAFNSRAFTGAGSNALYYQWSSMYSLNNAMNSILPIIGTIQYSGNANDKKNTYKAWCFFWKGYAYAAIGSQYIAGIISDVGGTSNNNYVTQDKVIARSNVYYDSAIAAIGKISNTTGADYAAVLGDLIPDIFQVGLGGVPTGAEWLRNINTLKARNILVNKLSPFVNGNSSATITKASIPAMTAADWNQILTLCDNGNGIKQGDKCFTGRSSSLNSVFTTGSGTVSALTIGPTTASVFQITERLVQNFNTGDRRFIYNFPTEATVWSNGPFSCRYRIEPDGTAAKPSNVVIYGSSNDGAYPVYIASSYEENALMVAEARIQLGNINGSSGGLQFVDAVRAYQGAGVAAVDNTGLNKNAALNEVYRERRVSLLFRGLSFYDSRRWGWIYPVANGGGAYNQVYLDASNAVKQGTIDYQFMDYWDVPADEVVLNPPAASSAPVINPNYQ